MMYVEKEEDYVVVVTDDEMKEELTEFVGNMTDDYWISVSLDDDLYRYRVKPKRGESITELKRRFERRLH